MPRRSQVKEGALADLMGMTQAQRVTEVGPRGAGLSRVGPQRVSTVLDIGRGEPSLKEGIFQSGTWTLTE